MEIIAGLFLIPLLIALVIMFFVGIPIAIATVLYQPASWIWNIFSGKVRAPRWRLAGLIVALATGMVLYSLLAKGGLSQTAALFIGLPAVIAIALTLTPNSETVTGMILKAITITLVASGIFFQEGLICIFMAAPLFYVVGIIIGKVIDRDRGSAGQGPNIRLNSLIVLPFLLMSLEGTHDSISFPREEVVVVERVVPANPRDVELALGQTPRFDHQLPFFLRLGFQTPIAVSGSGLELGDQRVVRFSGGTGSGGDLTFEIAERSENSVRFRAVSDTSKIAHWLGWQEAEVRWIGQPNGHTLVTWTLRYQRRLDPAWYFGPLEHYAARLTADTLIDTLATPR